MFAKEKEDRSFNQDSHDIVKVYPPRRFSVTFWLVSIIAGLVSADVLARITIVLHHGLSHIFDVPL